ncbi:hypothetical protein Pelo_4875 [Pelomyxa schiedti]|nr:hypothetical protein Pelo_4875 [Pelomyxa schiedti]
MVMAQCDGIYNTRLVPHLVSPCSSNFFDGSGDKQRGKSLHSLHNPKHAIYVGATQLWQDLTANTHTVPPLRQPPWGTKLRQIPAKSAASHCRAH